MTQERVVLVCVIKGTYMKYSGHHLYQHFDVLLLGDVSYITGHYLAKQPLTAQA